ncbi:TPBG protein, partial [Polypterus senegalus]|nr:trophoblast glycoprotein-like [Polypterus senegalus]MBN3291730.1 TPBG protein [Polypterus senegalus]
MPAPGVQMFCTLLFVLLCLLAFGSPHPCPLSCECSEAAKTVKCVGRYLTAIPTDIPGFTRNLFITGNRISKIGPEPFKALENLTTLSLSNNRISVIEPKTFASLRNLRLLDLSNNQLAVISHDAFSTENNSIRGLNLSRAFYNHSSIDDLMGSLCQGSFANLQDLDLSENGIIYLPPFMFSSLSGLKYLNLRNNSIVFVKNSTFYGLSLEVLDLSFNAIKTFKADSLRDFDRQQKVQIQLRDNPFVCTCGIEDFLDWLNITKAVVDAEKLVCAFPKELRNVSLLSLKDTELECHSNEHAEIALQTSYVFLGIVLGFIGIIFLFVLYLNRKGIKKWIINLRDTCRELMQSYHYRYEIDSDPRLSQVSTSDL